MDPVRLLRFARRLLFAPGYDRLQAWHTLYMAARGVDLMPASLDELGLDEGRAYWYADSGGPALDVVLRSFPISGDEAILDVGCGKGGAMITMARYRFRRIDGIEISPALAGIAKRNLSRLGIRNASVFCRDAVNFVEYEPYAFVYLFNPFPEVVLGPVLANIKRSAGARRHPITLIYLNPIHHACVAGNGFEIIREYRHGTYPVLAYRYGGSADIARSA